MKPNIEEYVEEYRSKGGKEERLVREILEGDNENIRQYLINIIHEYKDLSKIPWSILIDMKYPENINIKLMDICIRDALEDRNDYFEHMNQYIEAQSVQEEKKKETNVQEENKESSVKIIKCKMYGNSKDIETSVLVNGLYEAALEWYGDEYKDRLKSAIEGTLFYECQQGESVIDVEDRLSGTKHSHMEKLQLSGVIGMTIKLDRADGSYQPIIVYKKIPEFDYVATLAHELFYHQFCRQSDFVVGKDGMQYYRDGIALLPRQGGLRKNEALNEGFAEYNTTGIMRVYTKDKNYSLDPRRLYEPLEQYATQIASCCSKEDLISMITTGKPSIEELYGIDEENFSTFSGYLDMYLRTQDLHYVDIADMFFDIYRQEHQLKKTNLNKADPRKYPLDMSKSYDGKSLFGTKGKYSIDIDNKFIQKTHIYLSKVQM